MVSTKRRAREGDSDDPVFLALPLSLRRQIDDAFDTSASRNSQRTPIAGDDILAGGFIIDDAECGGSSDDIDGPGGFVPEDNDIDSEADSYVPLSSIPDALQPLGLETDDEVLAVFRNAATGWGAWSTDAQGVCKKDWRAVCAVLLGDQGAEAGESGKENIEIDEGSGSEGDEYEVSEPSSEPEEESAEEYEDDGIVRNSSKATKTSSKTSASRNLIRLTEEQKAVCRADFAKFFPASTDAQLEHQRITAHEIMHASDLLKEKLKPDDVSTPISLTLPLIVRHRSRRCSRHFLAQRTSP